MSRVLHLVEAGDADSGDQLRQLLEPLTREGVASETCVFGRRDRRHAAPSERVNAEFRGGQWLVAWRVACLLREQPEISQLLAWELPAVQIAARAHRLLAISSGRGPLRLLAMLRQTVAIGPPAPGQLTDSSQPPNVGAQPLSWGDQWALRRCHAALTSSPLVLQRLQATLAGAGGPELHLLPPTAPTAPAGHGPAEGTATAAAEASRARQELRTRLAPPLGKPLFGLVAERLEGQAVDEVLWSLAICETVAPVQLVIFGGQPHWPRWGHRATQLLKQPELAQFLPWDWRTASLIGQLDGLWSLASPGPAPLHLLHAMAAGVPIIAQDSAGHRELLQHRHSGLLVAPGREVDFARFTRQLLQAPDWASTLTAAARRQAADAAGAEAARTLAARTLAALCLSPSPSSPS